MKSPVPQHSGHYLQSETEPHSEVQAICLAPGRFSIAGPESHHASMPKHSLDLEIPQTWVQIFPLSYTSSLVVAAALQLLSHCCSVAQLCSTAIQPSPPLLPLSPPTFNLSQHQGVFHWFLPMLLIFLSLSGFCRTLIFLSLSFLIYQKRIFTQFFREHLQGRCSKRVHCIYAGFLGCSVGKESTSNAGDCLPCRRPGFSLWFGKTPGGGNGNSLQYSCLENFMDRGARWATVHGVAKSWTRLSD